jgi:hypothetical protein
VELENPKKEGESPWKKGYERYIQEPEPRKKLLASGRVRGFIEPESFEHQTISDDAPLLVKTGRNIIETYFAWPMVLDTFTSRKERGNWKRNLPAEVRDEFERNRLRGNCIGGALNGCDLIIGALADKYPEKARELEVQKHTLEQRSTEGWTPTNAAPDGAYSVDEKLVFMRDELEPFFKEVYTAVAKAFPAK